MDTYQTPGTSILQDSTLGPGHDVAPANPASQTRETVDAPSQDADNRIISWQDNPHFGHPHSNFLVVEGTPSNEPDFSSPLNPHAFYRHLPQQGTTSTPAGSSCLGPFEGWPSYVSPSTGCASAIERTSYARDVFTGSQAAELLLTVDQAPDPPFETGFKYNDANTDDATQADNLFLHDSLPHSPISADPRHQYEQPNFSPSPQHVQGGPVPYDHPRSSSTTGGGSGLECFNTSTASSSEQMLGAGPSLSVAQEQSPTTQEASRTREERLQAKKERDKRRKRNERSTNSVIYANICTLLDIPLEPKNALANRILQAVEGLVGQRNHYEESQRLLDEAESEINVLKKRVAQLEPR